MKRFNRLFFAAFVAALCASSPASADDFDLASQRSEKQDVIPVDGHIVNHNRLIINPTPQSLSINADGGKLDASQGVCPADAQGKFASSLGRLAASGIKLNAKGPKLTIDFGAKIATKAGVKELSGAYSLVIDNKGITITGFDERGAFYGLQSLAQIMESPVAKGGTIPFLSINDFPSLPDRGVVEGFYGAPWSHEVRLSLIDFYGRHKLCTYLYGPKDDPYHSSPNWRLPYPEKEARQICDLVQACRRNYVDFVWAIHPGKDIKWNEEDYGNLLHKLNLMYDLGVRSFALFFDDISGEGTNPVKQVELLNRLHREFVEAHSDVAPLTVCPTDYSRLWANPDDNGPLAIYGKSLHPSIKVFWTGDVVCSNLTKETLDWVNSRIKRPAYYWWNFPVTDYARHIIMQGPTYGLEKSLTAANLCGLVSNPMEHGEASKLALYGVADYCWNTSAYNPIDNWERGITELTPEARDAYRTFAIHSCDTETGYRRDESWETSTFSLDNYTPAQFSALRDEFVKIQGVEETMRKHCNNPLLLRELAPWLAEFTKLGKRGEVTMKLIESFGKSSNSNFWKAFTDNLMTTDDRSDFNAHKCGTMKLQPFYENSMDALRDRFFLAV
ncbi:MAG: beta-N-acetylglucosaminidase domain-containing protein, partial [Muribaculaceae bacterium]